MAQQPPASTSFRALFNETDVPADDCESVVRDAVNNAPGVTFDGDVQTIAPDYGDVKNITVDFTVTVDDDVDDDRIVRGRLNDSLMGDGPCDGLVET